MNELIKITEKNGQKVVNARDLHTFLITEARGGQIGEMYSHWISRVLEYGFENGLDYDVIEYDYLGNVIDKNSKSDNQGVRVHKRDYLLTIDCAKQICMLQKNDKGKQARKYFIECERQLMKPKELSRLEILQMALEAEQKNIELQKQIEEQRPKVEFYDDVASTATTFDMQEASALLKLPYGRVTLFKRLRDLNILMKDNLPYREYINRGLFKVVETKWKDQRLNQTIARFQTRVTQKGLEFLLKQLSDERK